MSLPAAISVAAFSINLFLAVFVLVHRRERLPNQLFFACGCLLAAWSLATFILAQPISHPDALRWTRFLVYAAALAPVLVLHLISVLFGGPPRRWLVPPYFVAVLLAALNYAGLLLSDVRLLPVGTDSYRWYGLGTGLTALLAANALATTAVGIAVLLRTTRTTKGIRQAQARYFLVGVTPVLLAGIHDFAGAYFTTYPGTKTIFTPLFPITSAFWASLAAYTVLRHRLFDLDLAITRSMVRTLTLAVLVIPFFLLLIAAEHAYHGDVHLDFSLIALSICTLAAFVVPPISAIAERKIGGVLFGRSRAHHEALFEFSQESTRILDLDTLIERINNTLTSTLGVSCAAVYVAESASVWRLRGQIGCYLPRIPVTLESGDALVGWLHASAQPVVREELEMHTDGDPSAAAALDVLTSIGSSVAIPLMTPDQIQGIVLLGPREDGTLFSAEDVEVLTILANQLATAMSNARLYADLKRSRELIQRSDRLSAIGTMAAGLAHEIRNPLVSIRTFTQLLPERIEDEEFRSKFLELTLSEVDRICALITELLAFARPAPAELRRMDVNDCLERICLLLDSQARNRGVHLTKKLDETALLVTADEDQVKQVVMNVVLNAIQACPEGGVVTVKSCPDESDAEEYVCIEVTDTGGGIDEEIVAHIFDPFFTTRREGTGLGLSIAHQIVTRHGGFIDVRSDAGRGTSFRINLPVEPPAVQAALRPTYEPEDLRLHG